MHSTPAPNDDSVSLVTVSYRGDLALARELCRSVDAHLDPSVEHVLVVPASDAELFESLRTPSRRIVTVESVLPRDYVKLRTPQSVGFGQRRKRIREIWLTPAGLTRGWIVQQIVKMSAPGYTTGRTIVFADSDIELVGDVPRSSFVPDSRTRLYRVPGATSDSAMHVKWHDVSASLIGIEPRGYMGADYIGNLISWRREHVVALQQKLESVGGRRWDKTIARQRTFSEYILYGVFVDEGEEDGKHEASPVDLVHAGWFYDLSSPAGVDEFVNGFADHHIGVAIQSTERITSSERRSIIDRIIGQPRHP